VAALRRHIYLEEEFLFPPLRQAGLMAPIFVMLREHGELWRSMDQLDAALAAEESVGDLCRELLRQLDAHNSKEEPIIYPQADAGLSPHAAEQLMDFLTAAHTPDGWVCQGART
jgi:iron-sulfur cluster repair protein YtfE (RIC family)